VKKYIGTKLIQAKPMSLGDYNIFKGWVIPKNEDPNREGYMVKYSDNYVSWSPKGEFDKSYRLIIDMTFGLAIEAMKKSFKVARRGWNGKGMYIYYVPANSYPATTEVAKKEFGEMVPYNPYFAIKNVNGTVSTWVPSVNDCLGEDYYIVE
jgi:hypothetical protein